MTTLEHLERPPAWREMVEDWWILQCDYVRNLLEKGLAPDFLLTQIWENEDHHSLFAKFGIVHHFYFHWREHLEAAEKVADMSVVTDPEWGGLRNWRSLERCAPPDDGIPFSPTMVYKSALLAQNLHASGVDVRDLSTVVHWGGGVGIQSLLMRWWGANFTEYVVDLPAMSMVQHRFLSENLGEDRVHLVDQEVKDGVINLVPLSRLHLVPQGCDMFLSLHALSESGVAAQKYVVDAMNWFDADKLVLEWTEEIFFSGTDYWSSIVRELETSGRVAPREKARVVSFRSEWNGDVHKLADIYRRNYEVSALLLGPYNWVNVAEPGGRTSTDLDLLMGVARKNNPIIILDVTHSASDRQNFAWVQEHARNLGYRLEEHQEALVFIDNDLSPSTTTGS